MTQVLTAMATPIVRDETPSSVVASPGSPEVVCPYPANCNAVASTR
jgi:hypothetical protein